MISLKGKSSYTIMNDAPGPGEYDPLKSLQALRDKSKGAKISGSTKSTIVIS